MFTIQIKGDQIDIFYDYANSKIEIYVEGVRILSSNFSPARNSFNTINLFDLAIRYREIYYSRLLEQQKRQEQEQ